MYIIYIIHIIKCMYNISFTYLVADVIPSADGARACPNPQTQGMLRCDFGSSEPRGPSHTDGV